LRKNKLIKSLKHRYKFGSTCIIPVLGFPANGSRRGSSQPLSKEKCKQLSWINK